MNTDSPLVPIGLSNGGTKDDNKVKEMRRLPAYNRIVKQDLLEMRKQKLGCFLQPYLSLL